MSAQAQSPLVIAANMASEHPPILGGFEWEFLVALSAQDHHPVDQRWFARPLPPRSSVGGRSRGRNLPQTLATIAPAPQPMAVGSRRHDSAAVHTKIEEVLRSRAPVAVFSRIEIENPPLARDVLLGYGIIPKDFVHTEFQAYSVGADNSLYARDEDSETWMDARYQWVGVEVKSRVFSQGDMTHVAPPTSPGFPRSDGKSEADNSLCARELLNVCTALRSNLRLQINQTCAFQATVSQQAEGGLDLMSLKKIVTLAWVLEKPLLFALCAPHRRPGSGNEYCLPISKYSGLAQGAVAVKDSEQFDFGGMGENHFYWDGLFERYVGGAVEGFRREVSQMQPGPSASTSSPSQNDGDNAWREITPNQEIKGLKKQLLSLWRVKNISDLKALLNRCMLTPGGAISSHRLSLAVKCLGFSAPPTNTALEFRMHEGMLDPVLSKMWGDVCVALVKAATQTKPILAPAGDSGGGENGNREGSGAFVDTEARAYSEMLRPMLHKTMGRNHDNTSTAVVLLRELGISPRQISLWESKMNHMGSIEATHTSLNQGPRLGDLHSPPSSSSLQVDVLSKGCTCSIKYTYSSMSFLPEVKVCTCTGGAMSTHDGTKSGQGRGNGHGGDGGQSRGDRGPGGERGHMYDGRHSEEKGQGTQETKDQQQPQGGSGRQKQGQEHVSNPSTSMNPSSSSLQNGDSSATYLSSCYDDFQPSNYAHAELLDGSLIDPALFPREQVA